MADHVGQADVKKCTTGNETSTYSVWELVKRIESSSGDAVPVSFGFSSVSVH